MKKILAFLLAGCLALSLTACGQEPADQTDPAEETVYPACFDGMEDLIAAARGRRRTDGLRQLRGVIPDRRLSAFPGAVRYHRHVPVHRRRCGRVVRRLCRELPRRR